MTRFSRHIVCGDAAAVEIQVWSTVCMNIPTSALQIKSHEHGNDRATDNEDDVYKVLGGLWIGA